MKFYIDNEIQYKMQYKHSHVTARNIALEKGNVLQLYLTNIKGNILYAKNSKTLYEDQNYACEIECFLKDRKSATLKFINDKPVHKKPIPFYKFKQLHNETAPLKCLNCGKIGYTRERCSNQNFL